MNKVWWLLLPFFFAGLGSFVYHLRFAREGIDSALKMNWVMGAVVTFLWIYDFYVIADMTLFAFVHDCILHEKGMICLFN